MILSDLKNFMMEHKVASIKDLATHFDTDDDTIREMLTIWIRKGKIRKIKNEKTQCNKCAQCYARSLEIYEWID